MHDCLKPGGQLKPDLVGVGLQRLCLKSNATKNYQMALCTKIMLPVIWSSHADELAQETFHDAAVTTWQCKVLVRQ